MAGGTWLFQNKVRPGAYINFKAVPKSSMTGGDRGIIAIGLDLDWGADDELIEVLSSDLLDGTSKKLIGYTAFDSESKLLAGALSYAYKALVYRMNSGGQKASVTLEGGLKVTAKHTGTYGNNIMISVTQDENTELYEVVTYISGEVIDTQKVSTISELEDNDYVSFSGDGDLQYTNGSSLIDGTNGETTELDAYPKMLNLLKMAKWQTFACLSNNVTIKSNVLSFIQQMREDEGRYVQAVVCDYDADYEGIINSVNGCVINGVEFSKEEFVAIVTGMTAGANFNQSNTAKNIIGATKIIGEMTDAEIKKALSAGKFILSTSTSGAIKVEQDINSLHTFTKEKNYNFSKNRVIRTLDEIGTTTVMTWEDSYMGKVDNNDVGRGLFKMDLIAYANELQRLSGIQEFEAGDITISQGTDLDAVICDWYVKPVDSMEKLYMSVNVKS